MSTIWLQQQGIDTALIPQRLGDPVCAVKHLMCCAPSLAAFQLQTKRMHSSINSWGQASVNKNTFVVPKKLQLYCLIIIFSLRSLSQRKLQATVGCVINHTHSINTRIPLKFSDSFGRAKKVASRTHRCLLTYALFQGSPLPCVHVSSLKQH